MVEYILGVLYNDHQRKPAESRKYALLERKLLKKIAADYEGTCISDDAISPKFSFQDREKLELFRKHMNIYWSFEWLHHHEFSPIQERSERKQANIARQVA